MQKHVTVLPGDGIGPEIIHQTLRVMNEVNSVFGHKFKISEGLIGDSSINRCGSPLADDVIQLCKKSDATLLGAIGHPDYDNKPELKIRPEQGLLKLRKAMKLYANIRPFNSNSYSKHISPLKYDRIRNVDFIIYRELIGGLYFGEKSLSENGRTASDICTYSYDEISRIAELAFDSASKRNNKLTLIDKANVLETSRLWRKVVQEMIKNNPSVEVDYMFVDNAAMQLMLNPQQFDVILTENLFGDILSDLASIIPGSIGMIPSASIGPRSALFEPIHGSYPQAAGKDIANPIATILSLAMMYEYFNLNREAELIRDTINQAIAESKVTKDLNPKEFYSCSEVGNFVCNYIFYQSEYVEDKMTNYREA